MWNNSGSPVTDGNTSALNQSQNSTGPSAQNNEQQDNTLLSIPIAPNNALLSSDNAPDLILSPTFTAYSEFDYSDCSSTSKMNFDDPFALPPDLLSHRYAPSASLPHDPHNLFYPMSPSFKRNHQIFDEFSKFFSERAVTTSIEDLSTADTRPAPETIQKEASMPSPSPENPQTILSHPLPLQSQRPSELSINNTLIHQIYSLQEPASTQSIASANFLASSGPVNSEESHQRVPPLHSLSGGLPPIPTKGPLPPFQMRNHNQTTLPPLQGNIQNSSFHGNNQTMKLQSIYQSTVMQGGHNSHSQVNGQISSLQPGNSNSAMQIVGVNQNSGLDGFSSNPSSHEHHHSNLSLHTGSQNMNLQINLSTRVQGVNQNSRMQGGFQNSSLHVHNNSPSSRSHTHEHNNGFHHNDYSILNGSHPTPSPQSSSNATMNSQTNNGNSIPYHVTNTVPIHMNNPTNSSNQSANFNRTTIYHMENHPPLLHPSSLPQPSPTQSPISSISPLSPLSPLPPPINPYPQPYRNNTETHYSETHPSSSPTGDETPLFTMDVNKNLLEMNLIKSFNDALPPVSSLPSLSHPSLSFGYQLFMPPVTFCIGKRRTRTTVYNHCYENSTTTASFSPHQTILPSPGVFPISANSEGIAQLSLPVSQSSCNPYTLPNFPVGDNYYSNGSSNVTSNSFLPLSHNTFHSASPPLNGPHYSPPTNGPNPSFHSVSSNPSSNAGAHSNNVYAVSSTHAPPNHFLPNSNPPNYSTGSPPTPFHPGVGNNNVSFPSSGSSNPSFAQSSGNNGFHPVNGGSTHSFLQGVGENFGNSTVVNDGNGPGNSHGVAKMSLIPLSSAFHSSSFPTSKMHVTSPEYVRTSSLPHLHQPGNDSNQNIASSLSPPISPSLSPSPSSSPSLHIPSANLRESSVTTTSTRPFPESQQRNLSPPESLDLALPLHIDGNVKRKTGGHFPSPNYYKRVRSDNSAFSIEGGESNPSLPSPLHSSELLLCNFQKLSLLNPDISMGGMTLPSPLSPPSITPSPNATHISNANNTSQSHLLGGAVHASALSVPLSHQNFSREVSKSEVAENLVHTLHRQNINKHF